MFDIAPTELLLVAFVALVVIGPKDLPKAMRVVGYWVGRARGVARQFRSGFDAMVREAELEEMEKKWAAENERIMREHPAPSDDPDAIPDRGLPAGHVHDEPAPDTHSTAAEQPIMVEKPEVSPATKVEPGRSEGAAS
ncbi:Sec-independent protein translocase protein TatB [Sphingomonas mollis]|uniref:Twin-arginine translocase subunit TatB n=1 Tax=Sphingomonas mollis TaxID=2795726 RepID=A0ABS0XKT8_9SPHN|nr:Sec-independent protein translocase protein TatB [Sphingomonas sp. BT553]MBJ6120651.1 twin-arginine translocase subunit TatB [Sphingomonas sp. BT553]